MFGIKDKTALITGASRGIGKSIAELFCQRGIKVAGISRDITPINEIQIPSSTSGSIKGYSCDIADWENVKEMVLKVLEDFERIDILINNAGITKDTLLARMTEEQWDDV